MIYERSFFIISYLTLSSLIPHAGSLATELTRLKTNDNYNVVSRTVSQINIDTDKERQKFADYGKEKFIQTTSQLKTLNQEESQNKLQQKTEELNIQTIEEQPQVFNKRWSLVAMFITSILFLFLIWVLLQKEHQNQDQENIDKLLPSQDQDIFNQIDDDSGILDEEEMISSELFPMLSKNHQENLSLNPSENEILTNFNNINDNYLQEPKIADEIKENLLEQTDSDQLSNKVDEGVEIASNDNEDEDNFELIKDLQQSDRELRHKAIKKLAQKGDFRVIEPLTSIVYHANAQDKSLVIDAITQIANRSFEPINQALFKSLEDENSEVRKNAIRDLTVLYECISQITKCLFIQMLEDSDQEVQQAAKQALEKFDLQPLPSISESYAATCHQD